ncbi:MAG: hypothetical protein WA324_14450 [Bryobacteraceae bacterium]
MRPVLLLFLMLPFLGREGSAQISPYRIDTIAGSLANGDGGPATSALLLQAQGLALDSQGRLYIADVNDNRVRRIDSNGTIETVAGTGVAGFSGDDGFATNARLRNPYGLAIDGNNNLYIADLGNARVRKVTPSGIISTYAGGGMIQPGVANDGGAGSDYLLGAPRDLAVDPHGNLFVSDFSRNQVFEISPAGILTTAAGTGSAGYTGDYGAAQLATLNAPAGLTFTSDGHLLICDSGNKVVRRILGDLIETYLPTPTLASGLTLSAPTAIAFGSGGFLMISDPGAGVLYVVSIANGNVSTLPYAEDLAVDAQSNIYLSQQGFVSMIAPTQAKTILAGINNVGFFGEGITATSARLNQPLGVVADSAGNTYIADAGTNRIRRTDSSGNITTFAGTGTAGYSGDGGSATAAELSAPSAVAFDSAGNLLVTDTGNNAIRSISPLGFISTAVPPADLNHPEYAFGAGGSIYVSNSGAHTVLKVDSQGSVQQLVGTGTAGSSGDLGQASAATLDFPRGLAMDSKGDLYIADSGAGVVRMVTPAGVISTVTNADNGPWISPSGLAFTSDGSLVVSDSGTHDIRALHSDGTVSVLAGTGSAGFSGDTYSGTSAQLDGPESVFASSGGTILVADTGNNRIRALSLLPAVIPHNTPIVKVVNAASGAPGAFAPGEMVEVVGAFELGAQAVSAPANAAQLPLYLGDTQVDINGLPVPLLMVETGQIELQVPYGISGSQSALLQIFYQGALVATETLRVGVTHPGLYTYGSRSQAMALMQNNAYNRQSNPVAAGSPLTVFVTGDGLTNGSNVSGVSRTSATTPVLPVSVTIDSKPAALISAADVVGYEDLLQVQFTVPSNLTAGNHAVRVQVGSMATQPGVTIWVSQPSSNALRQMRPQAISSPGSPAKVQMPGRPASSGRN